MIIENEILYLNNSAMSHIEWYTSLNLPTEKFDSIIRGYTKNDKIIYYKGDFEYDDEVIDVAKNTCSQIMGKIGNYDLKVYAGVTKGEVGTEWEPSVEINFIKLK